ncbi:cytochrome P450 [Favolaschia claudopus]|uniref:Cytochrome P450 n=1 Tax=Favolaschia claudopus TaxID=2862362 RepID=A0AAW0E1N9_9AGAR
MNTTIALFLLGAGFYIVRTILRRCFSPLANIPGPPSKSLIAGEHNLYHELARNLKEFHAPDDWEFQHSLERDYQQVVKITGILNDHQLFVFDPAALSSILVQAQDVFDEQPMLMCLAHLLFGRGILTTVGEEHRRFRKIMTPAFSTTNLRELVPLFFEVAQKARDGLIAPNLVNGPKTLDMNSVSCRISLELIGRAGIGYSFDPMIHDKDQTNEFGTALRALFLTAFKMQLWFPLLPSLMKIFSPSFLQLMVDIVPWPALHEVRELVTLTGTTAAKLVKIRKAAIESGEFAVDDKGKDMISVLVKSNLSAESGMHLTDDELVSCTSLVNSLLMILFAATDTASASVNRIFHLLATHPDIQEKLRAEILAGPENPNHDELVALPYLDSFVRETLRLYPPASPVVYREARNDAVLPLSTPIIGVDGNTIESIPVPKGTSIYIAIAAANHNKRIWGEDALEFKPERCINGKAEGVSTKFCGVYGNTMTFVGGAHSCIGFKFAQLEMKVVTYVALRAFRFSAPDPQIIWRKGGVVPAPSVDNKPLLPMLVEKITQ